MVAMTSLATIAVAVALGANSADYFSGFFLMIVCSSSATIFVFSHLHLELKQREQQVRTEARTDPLTGLPNRKAMIEALDEMILEHRNEGTSPCLALLDLNDFKNVNDTLGHEMGDELLIQAAKRLRHCLPSHQIFRLGGDEFAALFHGEGLTKAQNLGRNLHHAVAGTYTLKETRAAIGCSIGIAQVEDDLTCSDLMHRSDLAMYKAKRSRSFVEVFDQAMRAQASRKAELADRLKDALRDGAGIALKYQPIFTRELRIEALEVYFRWFDEEFGAIPPREAVQIARLTQQIDALGLFVASRAIRILKKIPAMTVCINIEATQILDTRFSEALEEMVVNFGLSNSNIQLEIEEAEIVAYGSKIAPVLKGLADSGFTIAVDNFGSSTSSLTELQSLGISAIKLDYSVLQFARAARNIAIIRAKVNLASTLGMRVTCKGIGDQEDEAIAIEAGCDYLQGFKYGRPDNAEAFMKQSEHALLSAAG
jgi:diguanylate cyclase (GGDEF)-like protein